MEKEVLAYIARFTDYGRREQVIDCFMNGCCARLAMDLCQRFYPAATMMYCEKVNHFGARICDRVYDITGDVTDKYEWETWAGFAVREPGMAENIHVHCILMEGRV